MVSGKRRLKSASDIRRFLASIINKVEAGDMDAQVAGRLGYLSNVLLKAVEVSEIENRLSKLEESHGQQV